jgi:hypothetical protein
VLLEPDGEPVARQRNYDRANRESFSHRGRSSANRRAGSKQTRAPTRCWRWWPCASPSIRRPRTFRFTGDSSSSASAAARLHRT